MQPDPAAAEPWRLPAARSQDALFFANADFTNGGPRITAVNARFEAMTGDAASAVAGRSLRRLEVAADAHQRSQLRSGLERGEPVGPVWLRETRPDGSPFTMEVSLEPMRDESGQLTGFVGVARDAAEHSDSEEMIRQVVEYAPAGMLMVDADGTIGLVNEEAVRIFGYRRDELMGMSVDRLVPKESREGHARQREGYAAAPSARSMGRQRDLEAERRDGSRVPVEIGLVPLELHSGSHVVASVVDITERKAAEANEAWLRQELERRNAELQAAVERSDALAEEAEAASRAKTSFLATVGHELRTPLNAILGFTDLLEQEVHGPLGDSRYREYIDTLAATGRQMQTLVARLLELTRAVAGEAEITPTDLDAAQVLTDAAERAASRAGERAPAIDVELQSGRMPAVVDRRCLQRIADELLANAAQHGDPAGTVRVVAAPQTGGGVTFTVADDGPGMSEDVASEAVQAFVQPTTAYTRHQAGLGIGLSLAKALATAHGGDLRIEARPDGGTAVHVTLPNPDAPAAA
ncbi:protein-histidine pros-kinase [Limimonas halophila]|uniref:histidine kinase n=1 Tax=Limimonas halophila TaxID=1082479 RepID=A0A1G7U0F5_9PROT|nr:PAS domain S-box protein [Limimonas halophila]SDG41022.1 protein-histidine pros-kinase [Limimonas halophila]